MKLDSCCRERKMQFSGPILRSLANFYIELEQFCCKSIQIRYFCGQLLQKAVNCVMWRTDLCLSSSNVCIANGRSCFPFMAKINTFELTILGNFQ